jgi:hypothetical protein
MLKEICVYRVPLAILILTVLVLQGVGCARYPCNRDLGPENYHFFIAPDKSWHPTVSLNAGDQVTIEATGLVYMEPGGGVTYGWHDPDGCNPACSDPCHDGQDPGELVCRHMCGPGCVTGTTWYWALVGSSGGAIFLCGTSWNYTATEYDTLRLAINIGYPELCSGGFSVDITVDRASQ